MAVVIEMVNDTIDVTPQEEQVAVEPIGTGMVYQATGTGTNTRIGYITLFANKWVYTGVENRYAQIVSIEGVTEKDQVNMTIDGEQALIFREKDVGFYAENEDGVVTVFAIGQKPTQDYTMQVTIVGVELYG